MIGVQGCGPAAANLVIVERAYRGAFEVGYFDVLYQLLEIHRQLNGADLLLRGHAVTYAFDMPGPGEFIEPFIGEGEQSRLNDPRADVVRLVAAGVGVMVDGVDMDTFATEGKPVIDGVRIVNSAELYRHWPDYGHILYM